MTEKKIDDETFCPSCRGEVASLVAPDTDIIWHRIFAAMAMQGLCARTEVSKVARGDGVTYDSMAYCAAQLADALLTELKKGGGE